MAFLMGREGSSLVGAFGGFTCAGTRWDVVDYVASVDALECFVLGAEKVREVGLLWGGDCEDVRNSVRSRVCWIPPDMTSDSVEMAPWKRLEPIGYSF